jgi:hypothetical protein
MILGFEELLLHQYRFWIKAEDYCNALHLYYDPYLHQDDYEELKLKKLLILFETKLNL